jgi:MFS family permease
MKRNPYSTRQSYTMAVVPVEERSAVGGFTGVARTTGAAISPLLAGFLFARPSLISAPFFIAGTLKIVYDLLLFFFVSKTPAPENRDLPDATGYGLESWRLSARRRSRRGRPHLHWFSVQGPRSAPHLHSDHATR